MRTTIDIPNDLMKKAKIKAAEEGITLKELFIKSLKSEVEVNAQKHAEKLKKLRSLGNADKLNPEDSGFDPDFEPESEFFFYVNEPTKKGNKKE